MQQEKQNQRPKIPHSVIIENRASISFTGVRDMGSFDEQAEIGRVHV